MHELAHKICPQCEARVLDEHRFCPSCGSDISSVAALDGDPYLGVVIEDRYRIDELLGAGAMGRVYRAEQTTLHKSFAVKILSPQLTNDPDSQARFANEAHNCASLNHPNVVSVVDYGRTHDGITYLVMEHIVGRSLEAIIYDEFPLPRERIADLTLQILAALAEAHGLGILHRDLKPENILIQTLRTRGELLKVLDFGIAKLMDDAPNARARPGLTSQGVVCGTPEYMSPEQACGLKLDQRSDLYAVGIILYQMLTGRPPFESDSAVEILHHHIHETPIPPSEVLGRPADPLEAVCLRALSKEREARFPDAAAFREAVVEAARTSTAIQIDCANCGEQMRAEDRFCPACGTPAPAPEAQPAPATRVERRSTRALRQATGEATAEVLLRALPSRLAGEAAAALINAGTRQLEQPRAGLYTQVLAGSSGSGKSRLLDELSDLAEHFGWRVVTTGCEPTGAMTALWPIRVVVAALLNIDHRVASPGEISRAASIIGLSYEALPGLQELFGVGVGAGVGPNAVEYAVRRRECFTSAVQALTESGGPLLLVFDDIDRWDAPSRRVLQQLVKARSEHAILVLMATAEEQRDWLQSPVVGLPRLDAKEIEEWAEGLAHAGSPLPARLASHAPMTPFELELALRSVPAEGEAISFEAAAETWIARLAAPERQVLELASALGERVEYDDLDALWACDPLGQEGQLRHHLVALEHAALLVPTGEFDNWSFRSRRLHDFVSRSLERNRSRHLHREAAVRTEAAQMSPTVRALHLLRAQPSKVRDTAARVQTVELIEALREAAVSAVASFDDPKAVRLLRTALKACRRLGGDDRVQHEAHLIADLVDPFCFTDRVDEAITTLRKVLGSKQAVDLESDMQRALGRCLSRKRDWDGAIEAYQRALGPLIAHGRRPALLALYADLARAHAHNGKIERGLRELNEGLDMCTLGDGPRAQVDVSMWRYLLTAADLHERAGSHREARTWAEHALYQAERRSEDLGKMRAYETLGRLLRVLKQSMLAEQHVGRGLELARKLGDRRTSAEFLLLRAHLRLAAGRPDDARRCLDEALRLTELLEWERGIKRAREELAKL